MLSVNWEELLGIDWNTEWPKIATASAQRGLDPMFLKAVRAQENGRPGYEFGVQHTVGFDKQLEVACTTVAHRLASYSINPLIRDAFGRVRYATGWIAYFASIWAPIGADNDPNDLNKHWYPNVCQFYKRFRGE